MNKCILSLARLSPLILGLVSVLTVHASASVRTSAFASRPPVAGTRTTVIPFRLINNQIFITIQDRRGMPLTMLFDTGAPNILTPQTAQRLGIASRNPAVAIGVGQKPVAVAMTLVQGLTLGAIRLGRMPFVILPLAPVIQAAGVPFDGIIGNTVLAQYTVTIDYAHHWLTLAPGDTFNYSGPGDRLPLIISDRNIPQIAATLDGVPGIFSVDTGSGATLALNTPFVKSHQLIKKYGATLDTITGWGIGGGVRTYVARACELRLGVVVMHRPVIELSTLNQGISASPNFSGTLGAGFLRRFTVTFDYAHRLLILHRNAEFAMPDRYDRSGMWINADGDAYRIEDIVPNGPASRAGLKIGDRITAINGIPVKELPLLKVRASLRNDPPGTRISLTIRARTGIRHAQMILRNLVPEHPLIGGRRC